MQHMPAQKRCLPASSMANSSKNAVLAVCYLLSNPTILLRPYPVSLKSTKLASLRLATKLPGAQGSSKHHDVYKIEALGVQKRRRGVVCMRRRQKGSRGCTERTGTSGWGEGLSTGEQSTQEFDSSAGGSIVGKQGDGSSLGGKGVDETGSAGARKGVNGVTDWRPLRVFQIKSEICWRSSSDKTISGRAGGANRASRLALKPLRPCGFSAYH
jgi:hypothetical protein